MWITKPDNFKKVDIEAFKNYLTWCNDYTRDAIGGFDIYTFRGGKRFAYVDAKTEEVFVDPLILET